MDRVGAQLSVAQLKLLKGLWFEKLITLYAAGALRSLNAEDWKALFFRTVEKAIGLNSIDKIINQTKLAEDERDFFLGIRDEIIIEAEEIEVEKKKKKYPSHRAIFLLRMRDS